jgi:hypothetical protein
VQRYQVGCALLLSMMHIMGLQLVLDVGLHRTVLSTSNVHCFALYR